MRVVVLPRSRTQKGQFISTKHEQHNWDPACWEFFGFEKWEFCAGNILWASLCVEHPKDMVGS